MTIGQGNEDREGLGATEHPVAIELSCDGGL